MQTTSQLRVLPFNAWATYIAAALFILGNILLPQLCHLVPRGGATWLPIYFFTLVGAYKYGWRVGLITAIASPLINSLAFGMPAPAVLPPIILKSVILAAVAGCIATRSHRATLGMLTAVVLGYQVVGTLGEWLLCGSLAEACQDFRIGIPGMLLQIIGGYFVINRVLKNV